jgi:hypothetical protein
MNIKKEWHRIRKREKIAFVILIVLCIVGTVYSFIMSQNTTSVVEHTIAECQHAEYAELCNELKLLYGETSAVQYALKETSSCCIPIQVTVNGQEMQVWVSSYYAASADLPNINLDIVIGWILVGITLVTFIGVWALTYMFKNQSSTTTATITQIKEEKWWNDRNNEHQIVYHCIYEYRDHEYELHTGKIIFFKECHINDTLDILYLNKFPNRSIQKEILVTTKSVPWITLLIFLVTLSLYAPILL